LVVLHRFKVEQYQDLLFLFNLIQKETGSGLHR
jgi:hypothetical protein